MGVIIVVDKDQLNKVANVWPIKLKDSMKQTAEQAIGSTMSIGRHDEQRDVANTLKMGRVQQTTMGKKNTPVTRLGTRWDAKAKSWVSVNRADSKGRAFKMAYLHWNKPTSSEVSGYYTSVLANLWYKPVYYTKNSPTVGLKHGRKTFFRAGTTRPAKSNVWSVAEAAMQSAVPAGLVKAEKKLQELINEADK